MDSKLRDAFGEWLDRYPWDFWATFTFRRPLQNPILAKKHFQVFFKKWFPRANYFVAVERFYMRDDCHLHALIGNASDVSARLLWSKWFKQYGRCRTEGYNAGLGARFYLVKYVTKELYDWDFKLEEVQLSLKV